MQTIDRLAAAAFAVILAGCAAGTGSSPDSTAVASTISPTAAPSATTAVPTSAPSHVTASPLPPDRILLGAAVRPAVPELNLREGPSLNAAKLGVLTPDDVFWLGIPSRYGGPIEADGFTWYRGIAVPGRGELPPLPAMLRGEGDAPEGWIAVARGDTPYVTRLAPRCPSVVNLANVASQLPAERLECFGSRPVVLEGTIGCDGCVEYGSGTFEPAWLAHPYTGELLRAHVVDRSEYLGLKFTPEGPTPPAEGSIMRVTGHFDDPAAQTCRMSVPPQVGMDPATAVPLDPAIAILLCRHEFVVDSFEVLGADPSFSNA